MSYGSEIKSSLSSSNSSPGSFGITEGSEPDQQVKGFHKPRAKRIEYLKELDAKVFF